MYMFSCLRHDAFMYINRQQYQLNPRHTSNHIFDKPFMARYIDNAGTSVMRQIHIGKSQLNRQAPSFFFCRRICINAGQGFNQGSFTMIYVAGRRDYHIVCHELILSAPGICCCQAALLGFIQPLTRYMHLLQQCQ